MMSSPSYWNRRRIRRQISGRISVGVFGRGDRLMKMIAALDNRIKVTVHVGSWRAKQQTQNEMTEQNFAVHY